MSTSASPSNLASLLTNPRANTRQCKRCFMTGKSCNYQRDVEKHLRMPDRTSDGRLEAKAFMLMPFETTYDELYRDQIEPCLSSAMTSVVRADDIMRTGFVVCEKICRQIQESHVVCAEISCDNPNVFYELGLAYALEKDITLLVQQSVVSSRKDIIAKLGIGDHYTPYKPFEMLSRDSLKLWRSPVKKTSPPQKDDILILLANRTPFTSKVNGQVLEYTTDQVCKGGIHRAINRFKKDPESLWATCTTRTITVDKDTYKEDDQNITFDKIESGIRSSRCIVICTDEREPCSYFWLGFAHGLEKDVVPVTVVAKQEAKSHLEEKDSASIPDVEKRLVQSALPFDVRALWHIYFTKDEPAVLEKQLRSILEILSNKDKDTKYRRLFWEEILQAGSVSIFVGSVELTTNKRHVVGEWDYRTVAELSGFLSSLKETMVTVIQTPVFQASAILANAAEARKTAEVERLRRMLYERNSIIIASADVNDMTEVALAAFGQITPFSIDKHRDHPHFRGVVGFKHSSSVHFNTPSVYFRTLPDAPDSDSGQSDERGFYDVTGGKLHDNPETKFGSVYSAYDKVTHDGYSIIYAHLAKFRLPQFEPEKSRIADNWTIVIQGISGPATLGLAQVLTGAKYGQFTVFGGSVSQDELLVLLRDRIGRSGKAESLEKFYGIKENHEKLPDIEMHSERMAQTIVASMAEHASVECIVAVFVKDGGDSYHDERKIVWWDFALKPRLMAGPERPNR